MKMSKSYNQKAKILYLEKMMEKTTEDRPFSMQEILSKLAEEGIKAERKSIYDDLDTLRDFGMQICFRRGKEGGYYLNRTGNVSSLSDNEMELCQNNSSKEIKLLCNNNALSEIQHAFGSKIQCKQKNDDEFLITVKVEQDCRFYGWLASMGRNVHICKPKKAAAMYRDYLKGIARDYKGIDK